MTKPKEIALGKGDLVTIKGYNKNWKKNNKAQRNVKFNLTPKKVQFAQVKEEDIELEKESSLLYNDDYNVYKSQNSSMLNQSKKSIKSTKSKQSIKSTQSKKSKNSKKSNNEQSKKSSEYNNRYY